LVMRRTSSSIAAFDGAHSRTRVLYTYRAMAR
jgi:hypothetical protein